MPTHPARLRVAIDGPAGAGKGSTARLVAEALGYRQLVPSSCLGCPASAN